MNDPREEARKHIREQFEQWMREVGYRTFKSFARDLGKTEFTVSRWANARNSPREENVQMLAIRLGKSPEQIRSLFKPLREQRRRRRPANSRKARPAVFRNVDTVRIEESATRGLEVVLDVGDGIVLTLRRRAA